MSKYQYGCDINIDLIYNYMHIILSNGLTFKPFMVDNNVSKMYICV